MEGDFTVGIRGNVEHEVDKTISNVIDKTKELLK